MSEEKKSPLSLQEFIDVDEFTAEINADIGDLHEALRTQPARASYYAFRKASASTQRKRIERIVKATEAKLKKEYRKSLVEEAQELAEEEGGKPQRISNDMVESAVYTDSRMLKLTDVELQAIEIESVCRVAHEAFRTRCDMIKSLSILTGQEMRMGVSPNLHKTKGESRKEYLDRRDKRGGGDMVGQSED